MLVRDSLRVRGTQVSDQALDVLCYQGLSDQQPLEALPGSEATESHVGTGLPFIGSQIAGSQRLRSSDVGRRHVSLPPGMV